MAAAAPSHHHGATAAPLPMTAAVTSVEKLSESSNLNSAASESIYDTNPTITAALDPDEPIPTVDLSLLTSSNPDQKSEAIYNLDKACQEWGFFMVVNHGIPEELIQGIIDAVDEFFNMPEEEKRKFEHENVLEPIRYLTGFITGNDKVSSWKNQLKIFVHPEFNCPDQPQSLRVMLQKYHEKTWDLFKKLLGGISEGLGLKEDEMEKAMDLRSGLQVFSANHYPPCPNPDVTLGLGSHSDHGLLTLLIQNDVTGLQIQHKGKWINVDPLPKSILVNTGDQLEVLSNGKYESVLHRAVVNSQQTRISVALSKGPSMETVVSPVPSQGCEPAYVAMKYKDYRLAFQNTQLDGKGKSIIKIQNLKNY